MRDLAPDIVRFPVRNMAPDVFRFPVRNMAPDIFRFPVRDMAPDIFRFPVRHMAPGILHLAKSISPPENVYVIHTFFHTHLVGRPSSRASPRGSAFWWPGWEAGVRSEDLEGL